jgi:hypothetical protein
MKEKWRSIARSASLQSQHAPARLVFLAGEFVDYPRTGPADRCVVARKSVIVAKLSMFAMTRSLFEFIL